MIYHVIAITTFLIILALGVFAWRAMKSKGESFPDYYGLTLAGLIWLIAGLPTGNQPLAFFGALFLLIGLINRSKWKKPKKWSELTKEEKRLKVVMMVIVTLLVLAGLLLYFEAAGMVDFSGILG